MVEIEEVEDEGPCYAFQVNDERIVFVEGQDFYPSARFPNTDFELVEIHDGAGKLVSMVIDKHGEKLTPLRRVSAEGQLQLYRPAHLATVPGRLVDIEDILAAPAAEAAG